MNTSSEELERVWTPVDNGIFEPVYPEDRNLSLLHFSP